MSKFKVGDRVRCKGEVGELELKNQIGTILFIDEDKNDFLVEFDNYIKGHGGNDYLGINYYKFGYCWWCEGDYLQKIEKKIIKPFGIVKFCNKYYK